MSRPADSVLTVLVVWASACFLALFFLTALQVVLRPVEVDVMPVKTEERKN